MFRDDKCYRPDEVAKVLSISTRSVYRKIQDVEDPLPAIRMSRGTLRIPGDKLNQYLERHQVDPLEE